MHMYLESYQTDDSGRYAYDRQPAICRWNLKKLAETLSTCLPEDKVEEILKLWAYTLVLYAFTNVH